MKGEMLCKDTIVMTHKSRTIILKKGRIKLPVFPRDSVWANDLERNAIYHFHACFVKCNV